MCAPALAVPLMIASTAMAAGTSLYQGYTQQQAANYSAAVATQNAGLADKQSQAVQAAGQQEQQVQYQKMAALRGQQTADYAAMGLDVGSGTPSAVITGSAISGEQDALRLRQQTTDRVNSLMIDAGNYKDQASADKMAGQNTMIGGVLGAAGSIINGASQISGFNAKMSGSTGFGGSTSWNPAGAKSYGYTGGSVPF